MVAAGDVGMEILPRAFDAVADHPVPPDLRVETDVHLIGSDGRSGHDFVQRFQIRFV
jgi:hypothetical protein